MNNNRKIVLKIIVISLIVVGIIMLGLTIQHQQKEQQKINAVLVTGFPKEEGKGFQKELEHAFKEADILERGDVLLREGKIDEAIKEYEKALSLAKLSGSKAVASISIANAYEKKRDYKRALELIIIDRDKYVNDWAKEPVVERAKYLEYALNGEYELAVDHAKKALEADANLPNRPKNGSPDYIQRLNDLKSAKDYILNLKN